ncbi:hypothetical protein TL16_g02569 [Triparma laevis f. inornata]|uniref:MSP domain-containing protein n=1 Tax=Triparma laevis f. inornata TaxID=1714386 RepID=A0A9W6ZPQ7_9STRA|nr:hypothetical protein TL16_g02569 [Triparma laevis f. inornata]
MSLSISPLSITFPISSSPTPPQTITVTNTRKDGNPIYFKVRRDSPNLLSLRPNKSVLTAGDSIVLEVRIKGNVGEEESTKVGLKSVYLNGNFDLDDSEYLEGVWNSDDLDKSSFEVLVFECFFTHPEIETETETDYSSNSDLETSLASSSSVSTSPRPRSGSSVSFGPNSTIIFNEDYEEVLNVKKNVKNDRTMQRLVSLASPPKRKLVRKEEELEGLKDWASGNTSGDEVIDEVILESSEVLILEEESGSFETPEGQKKKKKKKGWFSTSSKKKKKKKDSEEEEETLTQQLDRIDSKDKMEKEGKKGWFGSGKKNKKDEESVDVSEASPKEENSGKDKKKGWFSSGKKKKKMMKEDDATHDEQSQPSQSQLFKEEEEEDAESAASTTASGEKSKWGKIRGVKKIFGKKKKSDDSSVTSHVSQNSLDSTATPDTLSREIAAMTQDIASTPLTKEKKKEKRGWFSSGKKNPKKKAKSEDSEENPNPDPNQNQQQQTKTSKKKGWFGKSSKSPSKKASDSDEKSLNTFDEGGSCNFELVDSENVTIKTLSNSAWRMSLKDSYYLSISHLEKLMMEFVDSSSTNLNLDNLSELCISDGEIPDCGFLGGGDDNILMWPNIEGLKVTKVNLQFCGSTLAQLQNLMFVDMSDNQLTEIPKFETPFLKHLDLSYNYISEVSRVDHLALEVLNLSNNSFSTIHSLREIVVLKSSLQHLGLVGNRFAVPYREHLLQLLPHLKSLDNKSTKKEGYSTPNKPIHYSSSHTPTDYDASKYSKQGRNNIRMLRKFLSDEANGDLAKFLSDIAKAKAQAKSRLEDEDVKKEAQETFYKLQREKNNTNAAVYEPPILPAEKDREWVKEGYAKKPKTPITKRDKSPPKYLEATASRARQMEVVSARKQRKPPSLWGSPLLDDDDDCPLPYYRTPKGERVFDDDSRQKKVGQNLWKGTVNHSKSRNRPSAYHYPGNKHLRVNGLNAQSSMMEENLRNALNVDGRGEREDEMLQGVMAGVGSRGGGTGYDTYLAKLSEPRSRMDKRDIALAKKVHYERKKHDMLNSIRPLENNNLGKPRKIWKRVDGQIQEVGGATLYQNENERRYQEKVRGGEHKNQHHRVSKVLSEDQTKSVSRLYEATPKHWESSKPKKFEPEIQHSFDVSAIQPHLHHDSSLHTVKTPIVPRGFEEKVAMLKKGRTLTAEKQSRREKSMMLYDIDSDHDMFNKHYATMMVAGLGGNEEQEEEEKEDPNPRDDDSLDPQQQAMDDAVDRIVELEDLIESAQNEGKECFELEEEKVMLEEFVLEMSTAHDPPGDELLLSPLIDRNTTIEQLAQKTPAAK